MRTHVFKNSLKLAANEKCEVDHLRLQVLLTFSAVTRMRNRTATTTTPQSFHIPFSGTTWVSRCQKRTAGLYGARED